MRYLRLVTYALLFAAVVVASRKPVPPVDVRLLAAEYDVQAAALLPADARAALASAEPIAVSGGLPEGTTWTFRRGPDFDVWTAQYRAGDADVYVGVYAGGHPSVKPPRSGLELGRIAGFPALWWKHQSEGYRTEWDALLPRARGEFTECIHVWASSYHPNAVAQAAVRLESLSLFAPSTPNQPLEPTPLTGR